MNLTGSRRALGLLMGLLLATGFLVAVGSGDAGSEVATTTVKPTADAYVDGSATKTNFGKSTRLVADASPTRQSFLRFDLSGITGPVQDARLRIHVANAVDAESPSGGSVAIVNNTTWSESTIIYANRPTTWGTNLSTIGAVQRNSWVEFPVTSAVVPGGPLTLGLRSTNDDGAYFDSREVAATAPQLIVTTGTTDSSTTSSSSSTSTSSSTTTTSSSTTTTSSSTTTTSSSTTTTTTLPSPPGSTVDVAAVGDMACAPGSAVTSSSCRQLSVSNLVVNDPTNDLLLALGDLQYENGDLAGFQSAYGTSYGRIKAKTRPTIGNHEYGTAGANGYFTYWGATAGAMGKGYYSYDLGETWHVVTLNSNCDVVSCAAGSAQEQWLRADLASNTRPCVLATWHHPRFSSSYSNTPVAPFWNALQQYGADVVLAGHEHSYERFNPQLPSGVADANGIQEFVVGTGGRSLDGFGNALSTSAVRLSTFGVLKLGLADGAYTWQFVDQNGAVRDSGSRTCH
jgi:hypothetical protein